MHPVKTNNQHVHLPSQFRFLTYWGGCAVLGSRLRGRGFEPHCVVSLSKTRLSLLSTGSKQEDPFRLKKC